MTVPGFHPFPEELSRIPRDGAAVIEASAGTGKTFLIEHLVVDRLLRGDARIDELLVVTFTERAAAELRRRIQVLIGKVAAAPPAPDDGAAGSPGWLVDEEARARLLAAARQLDGAPISTIHAFCQRILTEQAFVGGRLLVQESVESRAAFSAAFAESIRQELPVDPRLAPYLETYLATRGSTESLEQLLYKANQLRVPFQPPFRPEAIGSAARAFAALEISDVLAAVAGHHSTVKAVRSRLEKLHAAALAFAAGGHLPAFLATVDPVIASIKEGLGFDYLTDNLAAIARVRGPIEALAACAVSLEAAAAQLFLPLVAERLAARKRAAGLFDFDDMLAQFRDTLRGPRGAELIATLRGRFKLAIVDEFQDTDPIQWEIFRTVFADSPAHPIYLVGDPKQAIYGFRGADVATYATACDAIAPPDERHQLSRNFRSTPAVIDAYNAILDAAADPPFFSHGPVYRPVTCGQVEERGSPPGPAVTLLRVSSEEEITKLPMRAVREALARAMADEIHGLLAGPAPPPAHEIFVLTRTWKEARTIEAALTARGVPALIHNQDYLHERPEAGHVRDLLRAIADPRDPARRLRAWLTPFFGLSLCDLPAAAAAGADHPLHARLYGWHAAAARQPLARLYARILNESGVIERELFLGESARRLVNYRHLFENLAAQDARAGRPLGEVARRLAALCAGLSAPSPDEGGVERVESDRDAVQIMTMHKSKGLEADVVFLYGGFSPVRGRGPRVYTQQGERAAAVGRRQNLAVTEAIKREAESEDQRLFYVALTRARKRLVLPYDGSFAGELGVEEGREELWKLSGGYGHVQRRLRVLAEGGAPHHFALRDVPVDPRAPGDAFRPRLKGLGVLGWSPRDVPQVAPPPAAELSRLARERLGPTYTSYSRIKHADGGYRPPTEIRDEAEPPKVPEDDLPGGAGAGIFVHDLLERVPLETLQETPELDSWTARDDIRALLEATLRRHGRDARQLTPAARLAHAALTAPLPVVGGPPLPGLCRAARVVREMEFLFPFPDTAGGARRGFVKGFVDAVFQHEGRAYLIDWKTDRLPSWDAAAVEAHVAANYALQERLYALALVRALGIGDEAAHEQRFGGTLYVFLRGLSGSGGAVRARRPSFAELRAWEAQLSGDLAPGEAGS